MAHNLAAAGIEVRLLSRQPERAPDLPGAVAVYADYADPASLVGALQGLESVFMVSGSENPERVTQHHNLVKALATARVDNVVYTSFFGASPEATFTLARDHYATEELIKGAGLGHVFLRDNLYADLVPHLGGPEGKIQGPAGEGKAALVAIDDIAAVASRILIDLSSHLGQSYNLTGPQSLTLSEVAAVAASALNRPFSFHDETVAEAYESRAGYGAPDWQVEAWVSTYLAIAAGELDGVSPVVEQITGRPAQSVEQVLSRQ